MVEDKGKHQYLTWVMQHGQGHDGRFGDLASYLQAIDLEGHSQARPCAVC